MTAGKRLGAHFAEKGQAHARDAVSERVRRCKVVKVDAVASENTQRTQFTTGLRQITGASRVAADRDGPCPPDHHHWLVNRWLGVRVSSPALLVRTIFILVRRLLSPNTQWSEVAASRSKKCPLGALEAPSHVSMRPESALEIPPEWRRCLSRTSILPGTWARLRACGRSRPIRRRRRSRLVRT